MEGMAGAEAGAGAVDLSQASCKPQLSLLGGRDQKSYSIQLSGNVLGHWPAQ